MIRYESILVRHSWNTEENDMTFHKDDKVINKFINESKEKKVFKAEIAFGVFLIASIVSAFI